MTATGTNVPKLRFLEFNSEWVEKSISDTMTESKIKGSNGSLAQKITVKLWNKGVFEKVDKSTGSESTHYYKRKAGQFVYSKLDFLNCAFGIIPEHLDNYESTADLPTFDVKDQYESKFLLEKITQKNFYKRFGETADGSRKARRIHENVFLNLRLFVTTFKEQQKIAEFLTAVDGKIDVLGKKIEFLKKYKKGIMQKIFSQEIRFRDENGKEFSDWEEKQLSNIGVTYNGLQGKSAEDFGEGESYITYKQIFDRSTIDIEKFEKVIINESEIQSKAKKGDIFFTTSSETPEEVGFSSVLLDDVEKVYLNSFCFGFRVKDNQLLPIFAQFLFRNEFFRKEIFKLAQGSTRYNLSKSEFVKLKIKLPSNEEQEKIAEFLTSVDQKIKAEERKLAQARRFKKSLLQQMFV